MLENMWTANDLMEHVLYAQVSLWASDVGTPEKNSWKMIKIHTRKVKIILNSIKLIKMFENHTKSYGFNGRCFVCAR